MMMTVSWRKILGLVATLFLWDDNYEDDYFDDYDDEGHDYDDEGDDYDDSQLVEDCQKPDRNPIFVPLMMMMMMMMMTSQWVQWW